MSNIVDTKNVIELRDIKDNTSTVIDLQDLTSEMIAMVNNNKKLELVIALSFIDSDGEIIESDAIGEIH